jgi:hypothetical protein
MKGRLPKPQQLPPNMPRLADNWRRWLCRGVLRLCGWSLVGEFPDVRRAVLIAAPHSSWWDGVWGLLMKVGIGAEIHFMGKQELFSGPLGGLLRKLGGMPIDRGAAKGVVEQMIDQLEQRDALWPACRSSPPGSTIPTRPSASARCSIPATTWKPICCVCGCSTRRSGASTATCEQARP